MTFRTSSKHSVARNRNALLAEAVKAADDLEAAIAACLKSREIVEGSREHRQAKHELKKTREHIALSRRRAP